MPTSTELSTAIKPATVTEYTLAHIFDDTDISYAKKSNKIS